ncbi:thiol:disulfide interchange protein DsbA/DsbL [Legionella impletisoli]|uniref:Thiol:disulfide interchange protein n=1 Tax=Legionella impletisoli TaxID=343510 RepID=A0A917JUF9_9GAMM|nr:thiol:disulfide interchange protein DsbA/DsbL [Legionella impletisoli]GGI87528.1 thiol:disulfide interchange protein [Legionella impletisoli]
MLKRLSVVVLLLLLPILSFAEEFVAGKDYVVIKVPGNNSSQDERVIITEFFSYGCPWCYRLEPKLDSWVSAKGKQVFYEKVPVIFNKDWEYYAKAFYTAQALSLQDTIAPALFKAILTDKKQLNSNEAMIQFLQSQGLDSDVVSSAFHNSPSIDIELTNSKRMMASYQIAAVPAVLVQNKYKTDLQMAKSEERLLAILDYLVKKSKEAS